MDKKSSKKSIGIYDECGNEYYSDTSQMKNFCPECSHLLYSYKNCEHEFENGRCIKCFWNGNTSDYIQKFKNKDLDKNGRLIEIIRYLQDKYGNTNIVISDHWKDDTNAIGLTNKSGQYLVCISTVSDQADDYYVALENPPVDNDMPYSPAGDFNNLSLTELESILTRHLRLNK